MRLYLTRHSENGFFICSALLLSLLLGLFSAWLANKTYQDHTILKSQAKGMREQNSSNTKLLESLHKRPILLHSNQKLAIYTGRENTAFGGICSTLIAASRASSEFPKPDWHMLASLAKEQKTEGLRPQSTFVYGDIDINQPLIIQSQKQQTIIVATGNITMSHGIRLRGLREFKAEILAVGDVWINGITTQSPTSGELLIYSAQGSVNINYDIDASVSLCEGKNHSNNQIRLRIEAPREILVNGKQLPNVQFAGCPYSRNINIWPKYVIIGKHLAHPCF